MLDPTEGWSGPASSAGRNADRARCGAGSWRICSLLKVNFYAGWVRCRCPRRARQDDGNHLRMCSRFSLTHRKPAFPRQRSMLF
jgi:hypothetical protein